MRFCAALLAVLCVLAAAVAYWMPVNRYLVECEKRAAIACVLERESVQGVQRWAFDLPSPAKATVREHVPTRGKGHRRTYLYLEGPATSVFAAQFETVSAQADAQAAADQLNRVFASAGPARTSIVVKPPAFYAYIIWGGIAFMALMAFALWLESRKQRGAQSLAAS